jgi:hypothetical protein
MDVLLGEGYPAVLESLPMRCCPVAALFRNRALLLWAAVLVPLAVLVAAAVSSEVGTPARASRPACPAAAPSLDAGRSCQEMHRKPSSEARCLVPSTILPVPSTPAP